VVCAFREALTALSERERAWPVGQGDTFLAGRLMSTPLLMAIYFTIWWTVLFAILPLGVRSLHEEGGGAMGTDPGAPTNPRLLRKAIITTIVSGIVFGLFLLYVEYA